MMLRLACFSLLLFESKCDALVSASTRSGDIRPARPALGLSDKHQGPPHKGFSFGGTQKKGVNFNKNNNNNNNKHNKRKEEYERRKNLWLARYGSVEALQSTFGTGKESSLLLLEGIGVDSGGDLTPEQTRRLYHTLLPRSLLALYELKVMEPAELAPLAYEARIAAKEYARSRCIWYGRLATTLFDQYRSVRDRRKRVSQKKGSMTWDEIWSKYEAQIVQEECAAALLDDDDDDDDNEVARKSICLNEEELTMRIYLRILEKSCATNQVFDQMFLTTSDTNSDSDDEDVFSKMEQQLDHDVREILLRPRESAKAARRTARMQRRKQKAQQKEERRRWRALKKMAKQQETHQGHQTEEEGVGSDSSAGASSPVEPQVYRWRLLRILAGTRRQFRRLGSSH